MASTLKRLQIFLDGELIAQIDQWRIKHMPLVSRSRALAVLLQRGMTVEEPIEETGSGEE